MDLEQQIKDAIREVCAREFEQLRSIVLTGSMARRESSFSNENGSWNCHGDAECLLVFDLARAVPKRKRIANATQRIQFELERAGVRCPVSLSPVTVKYFRKMRPHIFGYELRTCGDVIWGDDCVLKAIPAFEARDIPKEDGWRILANRLIELLESAASELNPDEPLSPALRYKTAKLYLDMASSYLVFQNAFEAGYGRRAGILTRVAATQPDHPFPSLADFVERVHAATLYKLQGRPGFGEEAGFVFTAISDAKALWVWELKQLTDSATQFPKQSIYDRVRGWAFVARQCGWQGTFRSFPRWLATDCCLSPRYSIYRAATEIAFGLDPSLLPQCGPALEFGELGRLLPVPQECQHATWRQMAADIAWNYHEFLEATRA